jgi:uncharacterized protein YutE (UPF0331/DUF86 family)
MDWLQFLASIVSSFAWPATVVVLVVLLRVPVARVLLTLTKLKYKDLELDFGRELKQLEEQAKAIEVKPTLPKALAPSKREPSDLLNEAERLAQDFPEPAVAVGWQAVEEELMSVVVRLSISPDLHRYNSASKNAELLREQNAIDNRTLDVLKRMRNLRNMAVHGGHGHDRVSTDEAIEFIALARGVVEKLKALTRGE